MVAKGDSRFQNSWFRTLKPIRRKGLLPLLFCSLWSPLAFAAPTTPTKGELSDCNWIVTYRGRTYDLAPLTREALARPIDTDLRYALQRVPESNEHLNQMTARLREAKNHAMLASVFVTGMVVARILQSRQTNNENRRSYDVVIGAGGAFFAAAAAFSWRATSDAKNELSLAVDAFNQKSPYKIEPATQSKRDGSGPFLP